MSAKAPDFSKLISKMDNSNSPAFLAFLGLAYDSIETFLDGKLALSSISLAAMAAKGIPPEEASASVISSRLITVAQWKIGLTLVEIEPGKVKRSLRSSDADMFDVSKLASAFGGGGHKARPELTLNMSLEEAKRQVVAKAKELYMEGPYQLRSDIEQTSLLMLLACCYNL